MWGKLLILNAPTFTYTFFVSFLKFNMIWHTNVSQKFIHTYICKPPDMARSLMADLSGSGVFFLEVYHLSVVSVCVY